MNIIIAGGGKLGYMLAERLSQGAENHVTIIDTDPAALSAVSSDIDVRTHQGNAVNVETLRSCGTAKAELFIAATESDERNILICMIAKKLGAGHTAARVRDPDHEEGLSLIRAELGLDRMINPERIIAEEIGRGLTYPSAKNIELFARGRVEMLEIAVKDNMPLVSLTLKDIPRRLPTGVLIGAIRRGNDVIIPSGSTQIHAQDSVFIVGLPHRVTRFCDAIGLHLERIRNVMIVGGGRVAYYLAKYLDDSDIKLKIIEKDECRALELAKLLPRQLIVEGDGSDDRFLTSENLSDMDGFVAITGMDEENLMTALMAKRAGVGKIIIKINRVGFLDIIKDMGIGNIVCPRLSITHMISRYAKALSKASGNTFNTLHPVADDRAEAIEFTATNTTRFLDIPLRRLALIPNVLVGVIVRKNDVIIPSGGDVIRSGDAVILFTKGLELTSLNEILVRVLD